MPKIPFKWAQIHSHTRSHFEGRPSNPGPALTTPSELRHNQVEITTGPFCAFPFRDGNFPGNVEKIETSSNGS